MSKLYAGLVGQDAAIRELELAVAAPVHAYLLVGPAGTGKRAAAVSFAAALLCRNGGCGDCIDCRQALAERHAGLLVVERRGASLEMDEVREVVRIASIPPPEGQRQVVVVVDAHLASATGPALLKTLEEPSRGTVFILTAEPLPPSLETLASRCVRVSFRLVSPATISERLVSLGADPGAAEKLSIMAQGSSVRALTLLEDPGAVVRYDMWRSVLGTLDDSGSTVADLVDRLLAACDESSEVLRGQQAADVEALAKMNAVTGEPASRGRKQLEERHHREERRWRTDELRAGLAALSGACRDRLLEILAGRDFAAGTGASGLLASIDSISAASRSLVRNPNETLLLQALLIKLSGLAGT
jgi:DNA polymerase-3 subunit delta'